MRRVDRAKNRSSVRERKESRELVLEPRSQLPEYAQNIETGSERGDALFSEFYARFATIGNGREPGTSA